MPKENRHGIPGMKTTKSGRYRIELPLQFKNADGKRMCTSSHLTMEGAMEERDKIIASRLAEKHANVDSMPSSSVKLELVSGDDGLRDEKPESGQGVEPQTSLQKCSSCRRSVGLENFSCGRATCDVCLEKRRANKRKAEENCNSDLPENHVAQTQPALPAASSSPPSPDTHSGCHSLLAQTTSLDLKGDSGTLRPPINPTDLIGWSYGSWYKQVRDQQVRDQNGLSPADIMKLAFVMRCDTCNQDRFQCSFTVDTSTCDLCREKRQTMAETHANVFMATSTHSSVRNPGMWIELDHVKYDSAKCFGNGSGSGAPSRQCSSCHREQIQANFTNNKATCNVCLNKKRAKRHKLNPPTKHDNSTVVTGAAGSTVVSQCDQHDKSAGVLSGARGPVMAPQELDMLIMDLELIDWLSACGGSSTSNSNSTSEPGWGSSSGTNAPRGHVSCKLQLVIKTSLSLAILFVLGLQNLYLILEASHRLYSDYSCSEVTTAFILSRVVLVCFSWMGMVMLAALMARHPTLPIVSICGIHWTRDRIVKMCPMWFLCSFGNVLAVIAESIQYHTFDSHHDEMILTIAELDTMLFAAIAAHLCFMILSTVILVYIYKLRSTTIKLVSETKKCASRPTPRPVSPVHSRSSSPARACYPDPLASVV